MPHEEWISWDTAAEIAGCPVPTIEWYVRLGHIERRDRWGRRPTLLRASVERFAAEHRARLEARDRRRATAKQRRQERARQRRERTPQPRPAPYHPGPGWLTTTETAQLLDCTRGTVQRLCRTGDLEWKSARGRYWVTRESATRARDARTQSDRWIGQQQAARLIGCPVHQVRRAAQDGLITTRDVPRRTASLQRASVERFARTTWPEIVRQREQARAERHRLATAHPKREQPPDDEYVWLDTITTALVLGIDRNTVRRRATQDRIPHTQIDGRRWFRRDHIEQLAAAKAAQQTVAHR